MSRYTGPVCRLCRAEGTKLFLKGNRCYTEKCAIAKRNSRPGQHGTRRMKVSEYGLRLREKQKLRRFYGLNEGQFRRLFQLATRMEGQSGHNFLQLLERRLDNVVYQPRLRRLARPGPSDRPPRPRPARRQDRIHPLAPGAGRTDGGDPRGQPQQPADPGERRDGARPGGARLARARRGELHGQGRQPADARGHQDPGPRAAHRRALQPLTADRQREE